MPTQQEIAAHLDMSERNARDMLDKIASYVGVDESEPVWWQSRSMDQIRIGYIQYLRELAAGRGGAEGQLDLTTAKAAEATVKAAILRLDYNERIGQLIPVADVAPVVASWASAANREYTQGVHRLVSEIQSTHGIEIDPQLIDENVSAAINRVKDHAGRIGRDLVEGGGDVQPSQAPADGRVDL